MTGACVSGMTPIGIQVDPEGRRWCLRVWRWSVPIGIVLGVLFALRDYTMSARSPQPMPLWYWTVGEVAVFLFWSLSTPLVLFLMNRFPLQKQNWLRNGSLHVAVYCGLAALYTLYYRGVDDWLSAEQADSLRDSFLQTFSVALADGITKYYVPILIAGCLGAYYARLRDEEFRATHLASLLAQAQLRALKMQIQPHFLFNTLHSISTLVHTDAKRADRMISELSELLRMTLDEQDVVPLRQEIEYVRKYLAIEQTRFAGRLTVKFDIAPEALHVDVPHLILQPTVENAVKHGVSRKLQGGLISIRAFVQADWLRLEVSDNGLGFAQNERGVASGRQGLGLRNTRERLEQVYRGEFRFDVHSEKGCGTTIAISVPSSLAEEADSTVLATS
jgi:two-component system LytT family sensor kinase